MNSRYPREAGALPMAEVRAAALRLSPESIVAELLALSVVEASFSPGMTVDLAVAGRRGSVRDNGRGMNMHPDEGDIVAHATRALTQHYPCLPEDPALEAALDRLVWNGRGSMGPAVVNYACPRLRMISHRGGEQWEQGFTWGEPDGQPEHRGATSKRGTEIHFEAPAAIDLGIVQMFASQLGAMVEALQIRVVEGAP